MRINIENYLHQIDTYFKSKGKRDTYIIYAMIALSVIGVSYLLFWDSSANEFKTITQKVEVTKNKINADKIYLDVNPQSKITQLKRDIQTINANIIKAKDNNAYIKAKIETISALVYDERAWGEYLHSISTNAKTNHIKLLDLKNEYTLNNNSFGHILNIQLDSVGSYKNTLKFINSLEQSDLVVDIHDLNISATDELKTSLNISVWGITY